MNDDIIGLTATFAALAVLVPLLLVHGSHQAQLIEDAWRKLAERHRLRFRPGRKLEVSGSLNGRAFVMKRAGSGNNAGFIMELALNGSLPDGLSMKSIGKHKEHGEDLGAPVARAHERTGQIDINEEVRVGAMDSSEIPEYLTAARMRAVLRLVGTDGKLDGRKLSVTITEHRDDLEQLDHTLHELAATASVLDDVSPPPGRTLPAE